jgi:hypothetical protein
VTERSKEAGEVERFLLVFSTSESSGCTSSMLGDEKYLGDEECMSDVSH